jgi:hypothetical protein
MARKKIELYAEAPYKQGYDSGISHEKFVNPYSDVEDAEADADDYQRGYDNAVEDFKLTNSTPE